MTELDIYKFIYDNELEIRWQDFYEHDKSFVIPARMNQMNR